jgi:hypothetical protein
MKRLVLIASAMALLGGAVLAYASHGTERSSSPVSGKRVHVTAHVRGLYPGSRKYLRVKVRNPTQRPATLGRLEVETHRARAGCRASNLRIHRYRRPVRIRQHAGRTVKVRIRMSPLASDACQGGTFRLRFHFRLREGQ